MVTDAAINIAPDLATKFDIVQNAIDLALSIGIEYAPRRSSLRGRNRQSGHPVFDRRRPPLQDGRARADQWGKGRRSVGNGQRGQLRRGKKTKGIHGEVAGQANILVVPRNSTPATCSQSSLHLSVTPRAQGLFSAPRCRSFSTPGPTVQCRGSLPAPSRPCIRRELLGEKPHDDCDLDSQCRVLIA